MPESGPGLLLFFTIDTEGSILRQRNPDPKRIVDEMIFGDYGTGARGGIGLHMDLLERYGFRGSFFVDVLMEYQFGREGLERTIDAILSRGHEVQLHVHDSHLAWSDDPALQSLSRGLLGKDADQFRSLMEVSVDLFERRTGQRPLAYRAGGFRINNSHFGVLEEFGIGFDSSIMVYENSQVSDWMLTRTQPFRIGGVLELPLTWLLIRDDRAAPSTRVFAPNPTAGDPISDIPRARSGLPRVATYISHSFQLMQEDRDASPAAIDALSQRIRAKVTPEEADRHLSTLGTNMRIYDGTLDEGLISSVERILQRVAERSDARCTTYGEFVGIAEKFGREERDEPVDPVPALDRPNGLRTLTGTRIYTSAFLTKLSESSGTGHDEVREDPVALLQELDLNAAGRELALVGPSEQRAAESLRERDAQVVEMPEPNGAECAFDLVVWAAGFDCCLPEKLSERFESAAAMLKPDGLLVLRVRTLGVRPAIPGVTLPPLAELLFSKHELRSKDFNDDTERIGVVAWDASTFIAWFAEQGFDLVRERRIPRQPAEEAAISRFADKLGALDPGELATSALEVALGRFPGRDPSGTAAPNSNPTTRSEEEVIDELAERYGPIASEDAVLTITPGGRLHAGAVQRSEETLSRRQMLRRLRESPASSPLTASLDREELLRSAPEPQTFDFVICSGLDEIGVERLEVVADMIQRSLRPGGFLLLRVPIAPGSPASPTTILISLLRAGLEVMDMEAGSAFRDYRLVRPLDFADIARFAGVAGSQ